MGLFGKKKNDEEYVEEPVEEESENECWAISIYSGHDTNDFNDLTETKANEYDEKIKLAIIEEDATVDIGGTIIVPKHITSWQVYEME